MWGNVCILPSPSCHWAEEIWWGFIPKKAYHYLWRKITLFSNFQAYLLKKLICGENNCCDLIERGKTIKLSDDQVEKHLKIGIS